MSEAIGFRSFQFREARQQRQRKEVQSVLTIQTDNLSHPRQIVAMHNTPKSPQYYLNEAPVISQEAG